MCYIWQPPFGQIANPNPKNKKMRLLTRIKIRSGIPVLRWWAPAGPAANPNPEKKETSDSDSNPKRKS